MIDPSGHGVDSGYDNCRVACPDEAKDEPSHTAVPTCSLNCSGSPDDRDSHSGPSSTGSGSARSTPSTWTPPTGEVFTWLVNHPADMNRYATTYGGSAHEWLRSHSDRLTASELVAFYLADLYSLLADPDQYLDEGGLLLSDYFTSEQQTEAFSAATSGGDAWVGVAVAGLGLATNGLTDPQGNGAATVGGGTSRGMGTPGSAGAGPEGLLVQLGNGKSVWSEGAFKRGRHIEDAIIARDYPGNQVGARWNNPTIDAYVGGTATSIKSMDLRRSSYASPGRVESRIDGYVNKLAPFDEQNFGGLRVDPGMTHTRELILAIPMGTRPTFSNELKAAISYGAMHGVNVKIYEVP